MKLSTLFLVVAMLFSVAALAGISPPTKAKQVIASAHFVAPRTIQINTSRVSADPSQIKSEFNEYAVIIGAQQYSQEVHAVARNGSQQVASHLSSTTPADQKAEVKQDVADVLRC